MDSAFDYFVAFLIFALLTILFGGVWYDAEQTRQCRQKMAIEQPHRSVLEIRTLCN